MRLLHPLSVAAVGIHISDGWIRWARVDGSPKAPRVVALDSEPVGEDELSALRQIVARQKARGTSAAVHVDAVFVRHLVARGALPDDPRAHHDWLVSELHRVGIAGDPVDLAVHARALPSASSQGGGSTRGGEPGGTALDLSPHTAVAARMDLLAEAGLVTAAVVSPWAAVAQYLSDGTALVAESSSDTVVRASDGVVVGLTPYDVDHTVVDDPGGITIGAGGPVRSNPGVLLDPEVPALTALAPSGVTLRGRPLLPGFGLAAALALVAMDPERAASFLGPEGARAGLAAQARGRAASVVRSCIVFLAVLLAATAGWQVVAARRLADAREELSAAALRVRELRDAELALERATTPETRVQTRSGAAASSVLYDIASALPEDIWLNRLTYRADSSSLDIEGEATDDEAVAQLLDRIDASASFGAARLNESGVRVSPDGSGLVTFRRFRVATRVEHQPRSGGGTEREGR